MHIKSSVRSTALLLLTACVLLLCGCAKQTTRSLITDEDGLFLEPKSGVRYAAAPMCYEPQTVGDPYASFTLGSLEVVFCEVEGLDPTEWLSEAYTGTGSMLVAADTVLPDLAGFAPDTIYLCVQSASVWAFASVTDPAVIDEVVRVYTEGEAVPYPATTPDADLRFKFASPDYPGVYYNLIYVDYGDARYLYDRGSGRCVEVGDLLRDYIDGKIITEEETAEESAADAS